MPVVRPANAPLVIVVVVLVPGNIRLSEVFVAVLPERTLFWLA
jgi:hypothetical protein